MYPNIKQQKFFYSLFVVIFLLSLSMSSMKYYSLNANVADFGIYLNKLINISEGNYSHAFYGHFSPILFLFAPLAKLTGETMVYVLLFIQSLCLFAPSLYFYRHFGLFYGLLYLLTPSIWFVALFDFHIDTLVLPVTILFFYYIEKEKFFSCFFVSLIFILIKETYILTALFCNLLIIYYIFKSKKEKKKFEILLFSFFALSIFFFFIFINQYFLPGIGNKSFFSSGHTQSAYSYLGNSFIEIIFGIIKNLHLIIFNIFTSFEKVKYILIIFLPFYFIGFVKIKYLIIGFPPLFILLISKNNIYLDHTSHYVCGYIIPIYYAFASAFKKYENKFFLIKKEYYIIFAIITHVLVSPSPISRLFLSSKVERFNFNNYIPTDSSITRRDFLNNFNFENKNISVQNNIAHINLFNNENLLIFPEGITEKVSKPKFLKDKLQFVFQDVNADYVLVDLEKSKYIKDKGCNYIYKKCLNKNIENNYNDKINFLKTSDRYIEIFRNLKFILYKKT